MLNVNDATGGLLDVARRRHESGHPVSTPEVGTASEEQLRLLVDGTKDYAIFMLSPEGLMMTWNAGAQRLKGYSAVETVGRHFSLFYEADAVAAGHPDDELEMARSTGQYSEEGWRIRKDGSRFWASVTITALHDETGDLRGFGKVTRDLTERRVADEEVSRLRNEKQRVFETLAEGVILYSIGPDGVRTLELATSAACDLLGVDEATMRDMLLENRARSEMCGPDGQPIRPEDLPFATTARTGQAIHDFVWGWWYHGTELRWLSSNSRPLVDDQGTVTGVVFSMVDVTERHLAQRALATAHARFAALVEHSSDVICIIDPHAVVLYASPACRAVYGEEPADLLGEPLTDRIHPEDQARVSAALTHLCDHPPGVLTIECRIVHADGSVRHLELTATNYLSDAAVGGIVTNSRDVTERVETATRLAHQAMHDTLTGLANRALLLDRVAQALGRAQRTKKPSALLFIDLDHFKRINDSLGHAAGDQVLVAVAERLRLCLRPPDTIARLGGDEFVVVIEEVEDTAAALRVTARVRKAINEPIEVSGRKITVDCSVGVTLSDGSRPEALLQQADSALYQAKARGRGRWELYDQAMRLGAQRRMDTEVLLRRSLGTSNVIAHYQPIVSLVSGARVGSEVLARLFDDQQQQLVQPDEFISVAEETGLIVPLGLEMLQRACDQQARWLAAEYGPTSVSVNLSACQVRSPSLVEDVKNILSVSGLPGTALCLELTESTLMDADRSTRGTMQDLSDMGIAIALDDFGTGMSSLAHLRQFTVNALKIDRTFVSGLGTNQDDTEVVKSIISLGRALGLGVIAEGVETDGQARMLRDYGCPEAQGYLFGRPAAVEALRAA